MLLRTTVIVLLLMLSASSIAAAPTCPNGTVADLNRPLIPCCKVPKGFFTCEVLDCSGGNREDKVLSKGGLEVRCDTGCAAFSDSQNSDTHRARAVCTVLEGVPCTGSRSFYYDGFPCVRYSGKYFPTALLLSLFLGWAGADRFYLGQVGWGVFKLLTIGGLGLWWFTDLMLLVLGKLGPSDGSAWEPQY
mmetsp:Transcript_17404/g.42236  ORF Transcript_17404/g.42236 Transcript_17404/m.42236 type:complete len:190 (+) Transcript_17404:269-838(+)